MMMESCLLLIFVSPALEGSMVDWLLENEKIEGFSTMHGFGHGIRPSAMSLVEQVAGRQRRVLFLIETSGTNACLLVDELREHFTGTGLHYLMLPVMGGGRI